MRKISLNIEQSPRVLNHVCIGKNLHRLSQLSMCIHLCTACVSSADSTRSETAPQESIENYHDNNQDTDMADNNDQEKIIEINMDMPIKTDVEIWF